MWECREAIKLKGITETLGARETRREGYREMWESREAIKFPGNYKDVGRKRDREGGM